MDRTQQRPSDGSIGVRIAARHHRSHNTIFQARSVQQLVEGVLQSDKHPTLMRLVILGR
jgi:hypothetical protein